MRVVPLSKLRQENFGMHEHKYDERDVSMYALGIGEIRMYYTVLHVLNVSDVGTAGIRHVMVRQCMQHPKAVMKSAWGCVLCRLHSSGSAARV